MYMYLVNKLSLSIVMHVFLKVKRIRGRYVVDCILHSEEPRSGVVVYIYRTAHFFAASWLCPVLQTNYYEFIIGENQSVKSNY